MNNIHSRAADSSLFATLLIAYIPKGMRTLRALQTGRLVGPLCGCYSWMSP